MNPERTRPVYMPEFKPQQSRSERDPCEQHPEVPFVVVRLWLPKDDVERYCFVTATSVDHARKVAAKFLAPPADASTLIFGFNMFVPPNVWKVFLKHGISPDMPRARTFMVPGQRIVVQTPSSMYRDSTGHRPQDSGTWLVLGKIVSCMFSSINYTQTHLLHFESGATFPIPNQRNSQASASRCTLHWFCEELPLPRIDPLDYRRPTQIPEGLLSVLTRSGRGARANSTPP